ncbi:MAG: SDR family NAD(P)-dependent oxidoreductase [Acidobacteriota bacterium]|nr:SDR family NAD(P)-dependent oxidoreductase [Acidobacteriota bacterium]
MANGLLAVITGASSGIGEAFARQLAARGYDLLLIARREDRLRALAAEIRAAQRIAVDVMTADLVSDEDRDRVAGRIRGAAGFALLVNNAGGGMTPGWFHKGDLQVQDRMHRLHVLTTLALSHAALENLAARADAGGRCGIINVASVAGFEQAPGSVSYNATKAWMISFTNGLAIELAVQRSRVKVQALCPGFTYSEFHDRIGVERTAIPKSLWLTAEFVAAESLRGFDRGQLIVVPGWRYKAIVAFMRLTPGALLRRVSAILGKRYRRPNVDRA